MSVYSTAWPAQPESEAESESEPQSELNASAETSDDVPYCQQTVLPTDRPSDTEILGPPMFIVGVIFIGGPMIFCVCSIGYWTDITRCNSGFLFHLHHYYALGLYKHLQDQML